MRIYAYGARPPVENADIVHDQLRLANIYHRVLVLIEHKRRKAVDHLYLHACPTEHAAVADAQARTKSIIEAINKLRTRPGDMLDPDEEMRIEARADMKLARENLAEARQTEKDAYLALKKARKAATPRLKVRLGMCDNGARSRQKLAYNLAGDAPVARGVCLLLAGCIEQPHEVTTGLAWGTRLKIGEFAERGAKMAAKEWSLPKVPKFDGGGLIAVQLQNGMPVAEAMVGDDTRLRIVMDSEDVTPRTVTKKDGRVVTLPAPIAGSNRSKKLGASVRLRVGSVGRTPIWATWPIVLHRPLPPEASIKWASIHATKVGSRTEWQLCVTVDDGQVPIRDGGGGTLAVNLGWRNTLDGGIRVAYAIGSDGHTEEVHVPPAFISGVDHVDGLRSTRDKIFDAARNLIVDWRDEGERPDWFMRATRYADQWKSPKHIVFLLHEWDKKRFDGDETIYSVIDKWSGRTPVQTPNGPRSIGNKHLRFWESDRRLSLLRMRRDFYRCIAARWAEKYAHIIITDMDLRDFAETPAPEDAASTQGKEQRKLRILAAPSELRAAIVNASSTRGTCCPVRVRRKGKWVVEGSCAKHVPVAESVIGMYKTQTCNACAGVMAFDAKRSVEHTCPLCGAVWDQDDNHCRNLLASASVVRAQADPLAPSVTDTKPEKDAGGGRWKTRRSQRVVQVPATPTVTD